MQTDLTQWVRTILVGRPNGLRAELRRRTGWFEWLDEEPEHELERVTSPIKPPADAPTDAPTETVDDGWAPVLDASEVAPGDLVEVFVDGRALVVVNVDDELLAVESTCPHAGGPLADGTLDGGFITCPWHGWRFDLRTGVSQVDAATCVQTFPVRVEAGRILVRV